MEYLTPSKTDQFKKMRIFILPSSEPYGIMWSDPSLLFMSSTVLEGDGHLLLQSIVHYWFGNLLSPLNWDQLWLTEGLKVYTERKIFG